MIESKEDSIGGSDAISSKAFQLNLDNAVYGTLAEIGAGQEVARWFFRVGGASGSIAKTISAYDMKFSDAIYGSARRYVSRERLMTMLDHEYRLLLERLARDRGSRSRFFAFANTVAAKSFRRQSDAHGWIGVRFQHEPMAPPSDMIIHTRLLDPENLQQQDTLGIVGVNLIYGATRLFDRPLDLVKSLMDGLNSKRIEVDMIKLCGPAFPEIDNRLMALRLVEAGLTQAALFYPDGDVVQPAETLYKKPILLERGTFRPPSRRHLDMLECSLNRFRAEPGNRGEDPVVLFEMNMKDSVSYFLSDLERSTEKVDPKDFLDRADILSSLGHPVLISNYFRYYRLASYLFRYTDRMVGLVMGLPNLRELFNEKYYTDLSGGILESFGRMFKNELKLYTYPTSLNLNGDAGAEAEIHTARTLQVAPHLRHLYAHLYENGRIECLEGYRRDCVTIDHMRISEGIRRGNTDWEQFVPPDIVKRIKERKAFAYRSLADS